MKFEKLTCCPFCGCDQFYEKQYARGTVIFRTRYDGEETDNSEMYDSLTFESSGRVYCDNYNCNKYIGNRKTGKVSIEVQKHLKAEIRKQKQMINAEYWQKKRRSTKAKAVDKS